VLQNPGLTGKLEVYPHGALDSQLERTKAEERKLEKGEKKLKKKNIAMGGGRERPTLQSSNLCFNKKTQAYRKGAGETALTNEEGE